MCVGLEYVFCRVMSCALIPCASLSAGAHLLQPQSGPGDWQLCSGLAILPPEFNGQRFETDLPRAKKNLTTTWLAPVPGPNPARRAKQNLTTTWLAPVPGPDPARPDPTLSDPTRPKPTRTDPTNRKGNPAMGYLWRQGNGAQPLAPRNFASG